MAMLELYHGTSAANARKIKISGFVSDKACNWKVKSKQGFVYLSTAYAPFYAMTFNVYKLALIKVQVDERDCYPEDDFLMAALGRKKYTQKELDEVDLENYKQYWSDSLKYMGNLAVKTNKITILGIRYFDGKKLVYKCDPVISTINFKFMGDYYKDLSDWIYAGKNFMEF